ncbi:MAG TPA: hypothetical protein VFC09_16310 [Candidatus Dormibacteraeota bacterium]|nr:hypothetical protein [Candidatus Dormibacteraeota bacterium]
MRVRLTVCPRCGHEGRLVIANAGQVISRCHVCGDELRTESQASAPAAASPTSQLEVTGRAARKATAR